MLEHMYLDPIIFSFFSSFLLLAFKKEKIYIIVALPCAIFFI